VSPTIKITDQVNTQIAPVDLSNPSSLLNYLKAELLHLAVLPDFIALKDNKLSQAAAPKPIEFKVDVANDFQLGNTVPEIDITPKVKAKIRVNASPGTALDDADPFTGGTEVPDKTGYVSVGFAGSLDLGVTGFQGDLTFGFDATAGVSLEYFKAFPLGANEPTLADALGRTMSTYVIPADISDLTLLGINDIATVSGDGSLTISGGVEVNALPNPLASVDLPLGAGSVAVQTGVIGGLTVSFTLSGSYQVRARRLDADTIEVSFLQEHGTTWETDFSGSAGVSVTVGSTDLLELLMNAISTDPASDAKKLSSLGSDERAAIAAAIKTGLDHTLQASMDMELSSSTDNQAAFQYHVQPARLSPDSSRAIHKALDGDLSLLTAMESTMREGGILAPGLQMTQSLFSKVRSRDTTFKINLLGIVNLVTVSDLILSSETLTDEVTGDVTIKETVSGSRISAITDPMDRHEALRKAMFDSVLATTTYRAGKAITLPTLTCEQVHFVLNHNTNQQIMSDYLNWFCALRILTAPEKATLLGRFIPGGPSTCVLRTAFSDADSTLMFFDGAGNVRPESYFLETGRLAMRALLDPQHQDIDKLRYQIVDDALWPKALNIGASPGLGTLVGLSTNDPRVGVLRGDVFVITAWADAMSKVGAIVQDVRNFVGSADPATLAQNNVFKQKSGALQNKLAGIAKTSKIRFTEPWGMVSLYWAAGSPATSYGKVVAGAFALERGHQPELTGGD
jgi:hypothetical protein